MSAVSEEGGRQMQGVQASREGLLILVVLATVSVPAGLRADDGPNHQVSQTRPIQLGTTGGNIGDSSKAFCCSGTLGSLVQSSSGTTQYVLSNNHVLARTNLASLGEDILQPGLIDQNPVCAKDTNDAVADLSAFKKISFTSGTTNTIDAAIAQVRSGAVAPDGAILDLGQVNSSIVNPGLGMLVKKSGRTSGLTTGSIAAINVTVDVTYWKKCGTGSQKARFINQIAISPGGFSKGGDSGSLIVEDVGTCPRAVGLLFAGSSTITIANPISNVLSTFGVSMVGCQAGVSREKSFFHKFAALLFPEVHAAPPQQPPDEPGPQVEPAALAAAIHAKEEHEQNLMKVPGVVGMGVGLSEAAPDQAVIEIYVERDTPEVRRALPEQLDNIPVKIVETGPIVAHGGGCGAKPCGSCGSHP